MGINIDVDLSKPVEKVVDTTSDLAANLGEKPISEIGNFFGALFGIPADAAISLRTKLQIKHKINQQIFAKELQKKVASIPENNICEPDFQTISTAFDNAKHCDSDELRELFANLIASSINIEKKDDVHPSFSEIIKQMSPLDARNLKLFKNEDGLPISQYRVRNEDNSYDILMSNVFLGKIGENVDLTAQSASITNLQRLGLLEVTYRSKFANPIRYDEAEKLLQSLFSDEIKPNEARELKNGIVRKTPFGEKFVNACIED